METGTLRVFSELGALALDSVSLISNESNEVLSVWEQSACARNEGYRVSESGWREARAWVWQCA